MRIFFAFLLHVFHFIRAAILAVRSGWGRHFGAAPQPLRTPRRRIPKHLAISLVVDKLVSEDTAQEVLTKSVVDAVSWCRTIGINKLTVYEENGFLKSLPIQTEKVYSNNLKSETVYPITPPSSDYSESPPLSPNHKSLCLVPFIALHVINHTPQKDSEPERPQELERRCQQQEATDVPENDLFLYFISRESSKPAIAIAAQTLARKQQSGENSHAAEGNAFQLSIAELEQLLEDEDGLSAPDMMIIHNVEPSHLRPAPPELHGFPPWHIRLTEIYQSKPHKLSLRQWFSRLQYPLPLDESSFRDALDEFTAAEMRFGK